MGTAIDVERIQDDCGHCMGWYAKGNQTLEEMIKGIEFSEGSDWFEKGEKEELKTEYGYMRLVPVGKFDDQPFKHYIHFPCEKGRGAFECTVVYRE
jgi:hypothetical protein